MGGGFHLLHDKLFTVAHHQGRYGLLPLLIAIIQTHVKSERTRSEAAMDTCAAQVHGMHPTRKSCAHLIVIVFDRVRFV
jgi:hypothetical protein